MVNGHSLTTSQNQSALQPMDKSSTGHNLGTPLLKQGYRNDSLINTSTLDASFLSNLKQWQANTNVNSEGKVLADIIEAFRSEIQNTCCYLKTEG